MSIKNMGENNPFFGKKHTQETMEILKLNVSPWVSVKNNLSTEEYEEWYSGYCERRTGENNSFYGKKHTEETKKHLSEVKSKLISDGYLNLSPSHYGLKGHYFSIKMNETFYHDSLIELLRMKMLDIDNDVVSWTKKHKIRIKYNLNTMVRYYVPDFLIYTKNTMILEELKGYEQDENKKIAKLNALVNYCNEKNIICKILFYNDIDLLCKKIFNKSISSLRKLYKLGRINEI